MTYSFYHLQTFSGEIKSVYVRNLPPTISASEIEEEFKNFGKLKPDGVVIRSRQVYSFYLLLLVFIHTCSYKTVGIKVYSKIPYCMDVQEFGICYAFVEFEDTAGVQNAIKVLISLQEFELVNFVLKGLVGNVNCILLLLLFIL